MAGQYFFKVDDNFLPLSGGTVSGNTYIQANLSADTLSLVNTPTNDNSLTQILSRDSSDGLIKYRDVNSIIGAASADTYVVSGNADVATSQLNFTYNTGGTFTVTNSAALFSDNDINVTGGTYNPSTGCVTFATNSGTTFDVCGFVTGITDSYTTGATLSGETIKFDSNILGLDYYNVSLTPVLSGKTNLTLFNSHTANTSNPHQTSFSNLTSTAHTHTISEVLNLQNELDDKLETSVFNIYSGNVSTQLSTKVESGINSGGANEVFSGKSGTDFYFRTISGGTNTTITTVGDVINVDVVVPVDTNTFVTGGTYNESTDTITLDRNDALTVDITGVTDTFTTGGTYDNGTSLITFTKNNGTTYSVDLSSIDVNDTFITGSTLSGNTLVLSRNDSVDITTDLSSIIPDSDLGQILFVSTTGDDITASKGDIHKPYRNLYAAKSASTSGDTVYVFPGTWEYDNRTSAGSPYNGQIETLVNLWKDGVNYYFSPGTKVIFYNQTITGERMYLFSPKSNNYETCNVYGELEWEGSSVGSNSSNGYTYIFHIDGGITEYEAYSCNIEFKSAISTSSQPIDCGSVHTGSTTTYFNLKAETIACDYTQGQSGSGAGIFLLGGGKQYININTNEIRSSFHTLYLRNFVTQTGFNLNLNSKKLVGNGDTVIRNRNLIGNVNINFQEAYFTTKFLQIDNSTSATTILNGTVIDNVGNSTSPIFDIYSVSTSKTIFNGVVKPSVTSGAGRRIIQISQPNNTMIFNGDILYESSLPTTSNMINLLSDSDLTFEGNVIGTFGGKIGNVRNGNLIVNNTNINSTIDGATLFGNDVTTTSGITSLRNSTIILNNSTSNLYDGRYMDTYILNSNIKNVDTSDIFTNTTNVGELQIQNSSLVCVSGNTINISGNVPLTVTNVTTNKPIIATNVSGTITEITELDIK